MTAPRRLRVLVVDDNPDAAEMLGTLVELMGHDWEAAYDGPAALAAAARTRPDVVFLDIGMPGMSGYEVATKLRADAQLRDVYLIALTGWGEDDARVRALEAGFDRHVTKPAEPDAIEQILASVPQR